MTVMSVWGRVLLLWLVLIRIELLVPSVVFIATVRDNEDVSLLIIHCAFLCPAAESGSQLYGPRDGREHLKLTALQRTTRASTQRTWGSSAPTSSVSTTSNRP